MKKLISYLSELNTSDSSWGLWVDPNNIDNYRVGQMCFENGGMLDKYVFVDTLNNLSFGFQSIKEILKAYLKDTNGIGEFIYKGKKSKCRTSSVITAYLEENLDSNFQEFLEQEVDINYSIWSERDAEDFVENKLPNILEEKTNGFSLRATN